MKTRGLHIEGVRLICWILAVTGPLYLVSVLFVVFHVSKEQLNLWLEEPFNQLRPSWVTASAPHFSTAAYWIPYWCAVVLIFIYKERVRFLFWLWRLGLFVVSTATIVFLINEALRHFWPELCGRSYNFLHQLPDPGCDFFSVSSSLFAGTGIWLSLSLRSRHWMVKLMLALGATVMILALLYQRQYFPLQMLFTLGIAALAGIIAHVSVTYASYERFPELYNYIKR